MSDIVIVRRPQDIPVAKQIVAKLEHCRVLTFDPVLVDHLYYDGIKQVEFFHWHECPPYAELEKEAKMLATGMENRLAVVAQAYFPDCDLRGWQHLNFYYLAITMQWYVGLWRAVVGMLQGSTVHVISCETPLRYYFNSDVPALLLIEKLNELGIAYQTYQYSSSEPVRDDRILNLLGVMEKPEQEFILTHLPTCVYDLNFFNKELAVSKKFVINLQSKYFDMPIRSHVSVPLTDMESIWPKLLPSIREQLTNVYQDLLQVTLQLLGCWLQTPAFRQRQAEQIAKVFQSQFCNWIFLTIYFMHARPSKIVLADHDADFHGPIINFAKNTNIPVLLLPHAKTIAYVDFAYPNLTAFTHPMQGNTVLQPENRPAQQQPIFYHEQHLAKTFARQQPKKIGLMLNSISLNGIYYCHYQQYIQGIGEIVQWCKERNLQLQIRGKPSYSIVRLIAAHTGFDVNKLVESVMGPLEDFVEHCDLCLMYDTPTSGCIDFLRQGIAILNPVVHPLSHAESTFTSDELIPRDSLQAILAQAASLLEDEDKLEQFRQDQFQRYRQRFSDLQPLHVYL